MGDEGGLEEPWDAESGRYEDYAEGGVWTDEEILSFDTVSKFM